MSDSFRVEVNGRIRTYAAMLDQFAQHIDAGGLVTGLSALLAEFGSDQRHHDRAGSVSGWVELDSSGLAYAVIVRGRRSFRIVGAAPLIPGPPQDLYRA